MTLNRLAAHMISQKPDHIALTGDLINIGLDSEISRAARWLRELATPQNLSVVAGNHDAYVRSSLPMAFNAWHEYLRGDDDDPVTYHSYPLLRKRGPVAVIMVNTAIPTAPFKATGLFDSAQADRLATLLDQTKEDFRAVLLHHPPFENATTNSKRLMGDRLFRDVIAQYGAELILHGHTHLETLAFITGPAQSKVPTICVPAGGQEEGGRKPAAAYNLFDISREQDGWQIDWQRIGYVNAAIRQRSQQLLKI